MANKMLIDAAHPEETRVVVVRGNRVEEFDFESASRRQLRGNIYLAKVTRVEPSLQAAFVDYGGNRHGFLAFSEIHPDYYQIPVADRQALIEAEQREIAEERASDAESDAGDAVAEAEAPESAEIETSDEAASEADAPGADDGETDDGEDAPRTIAAEAAEAPSVSEPANDDHDDGDAETAGSTDDEPVAEASAEGDADADFDGDEAPAAKAGRSAKEVDSDDSVESVGAEDAMEEVPERRKPRARQYKIQEVIKRRQVLLVQVVKEERGNKGAALTTYLSLAGRYSVLMPNTARGGGISRKITSMTDRKRLKQVVSDLEVPEGMGVILRTAGASRTRAEVKRDFEYLLRLWENVRELTLRSSAPSLVYEEGSLIKRSIRDLYNKDIDEVIVSGDDAYREAKDFMRMLMPSHAKNVQPYKDSQPLFARNTIESQLDAMFSPQVTLKSGGYLVINPTEALVSIDVNSGRSTREHNIEDTALQTNLEAADEVARQLRLRDLAGLIVIDFIDMEEKRNNRAVERRLNEALKNDRARIQVGRISHFGLLEMSRQRIRTGVLESTTTVCPTCQGTGHVRAPASVALHVLRSLEDQLLKGVTHDLVIRTRTPVALYILNQKRAHLSEIEMRFGLTITVAADETIANGSHFVIERGEPVGHREVPARPVSLITPDSVQPGAEIEDEEEEEVLEVAAEAPLAPEQDDNSEDGGGRRRRRRRRRRGGGSDRQEAADQSADASNDDDADNDDGDDASGDDEREATSAGSEDDNGQPRKRRRGRRGGRRGRRGRGGEDRQAAGNDGSESSGDEADNDDAVAETAATAEASAADSETPVTGEAEPAPPEATPDAGAPLVSAAEETPLAHANGGHRPAEAEAEAMASEPAETDEAAPTAEAASEEPAEAEAQPAATPETPAEDDAPPAPKRSGWWQRRTSFF